MPSSRPIIQNTDPKCYFMKMAQQKQPEVKDPIKASVMQIAHNFNAYYRTLH